MSLALDPVFATCAFCPWQQTYATQAEADRRRAAHEHLRHNQPMPEQPVVTPGDWQAQAVDAIRQVAARGRDFTTFEALREFGVPDPPNARTRLGQFSVLVHDMGVAHPVGFDRSVRPGSKRSAAAVWNRDGRRCQDVKCRRRNGVAV